MWTTTLVFSVFSSFSSYYIFNVLARLGSATDIVKFYTGIPDSSLASQWIEEQRLQNHIDKLGYLGPGLIDNYIYLPGQFLNYALVTYLLGLGLSSLLPYAVPSTSNGRDSDRNVRELSFQSICKTKSMY